MSPPRRVKETARRMKVGVYAVAGLYVGVGLLIAFRAALVGDVFNALIGLLLVSGALGGALFLIRGLHLGARMWAMGEALDDMRTRLEQLAHGAESDQVREDAADAVRVMNLAAIGDGDPSVLAAATLDRSRFPRLVAALDELQEQSAAPGHHPTRDSILSGLEDAEEDLREDVSPAARNLLRQWRVSVRTGDLNTCRQVYAALMDTADPDLVARLGVTLSKLNEQIRLDLRDAFRTSIRSADYAEALAVGYELHKLFPEGQAAADFKRLEPHLRRRLEAHLAYTGT